MTMTESASRLGENLSNIVHHPREALTQRNVGQTERWTSIASGSIATLLGLARRDLPGLLIAGIGGALIYRGTSGSCPAYSALGINTARGEDHSVQGRLNRRGIHVAQTFTIDKSPQELYSFWRDFKNLPGIMSHLLEVRVLDNKRSHWIASAPSIAGGRVEWDAETIEDVPNQRIAWRSLEGADVDNAGSVSFESSPRGTLVRVDMRYVAPAGRLGNWFAALFGENAEHQVREDLRTFKRMMELGEIPTTAGQPHGTCTGRGYYQSA